MSRICLRAFILLCIEFTSKNVFSLPWEDISKDVDCNKEKEYIIFKTQSYDHFRLDIHEVYYYLKELNLEYTVDGKVFSHLISTEMDFQEPKTLIWSRVKSMKRGEIITFPNGTLHSKKSVIWVGMEKLLMRLGSATRMEYHNYALLEVKWNLPKSIKSVKSFRITGKGVRLY